MGHLHIMPPADLLVQTAVRRPSAREPRRPVPGERGVRRVDAEVRQILLLVSEFLTLCELRCPPQRMIGVLRAVIEASRGAFERPPVASADSMMPSGAEIRADASNCVRDLEGLMWTLCVGVTPPAIELAHAMDALIMLCVQIDGTAHERRPLRPHLVAASRS